jgi:hypothetical protein
MSRDPMPPYLIKHVTHDEFGVVPGEGWVITDPNGKRVDWPMLATKAEAEFEVTEIRKAERELFGFQMMGAHE